MAALAQTLPHSSGRHTWLWELLKGELTPYPGRFILVARMVTAATLVMIISMTFRIPYGAYGAIYALVLSRESLQGSASTVRAMAIGNALGGAYAVAGAMLVLADPMLRFLWVAATLFLIFYAISAMSNYAASARFAYLIVITIPLWDGNISAETKVEETLWAVGTITIASLIALLVEIGFAALRRGDDLMDPIAERLASVEAFLRSYATGRPIDVATQSAMTRLAIVGTSRLRRTLQRSSHERQYAQQMGAVVALAGRLVDIAANLAQFASRVSEADRKRIGNVANQIAEIRDGLKKGSVLRLVKATGESEERSSLPLLPEMERTVSLIPEAFQGAQPVSIFTPPQLDNRERPIVLKPGVLSNPEHIKFGLRGCLAASSCYVIYNALFWPGISTAVTTCLLTALTTVGSSRQKQVLRFAGALIGGLGIGMGAQIFILPNIDSIGAFTVLFMAVAAAAAWIATSSSRLSYLGVQVAVAFCLVNLEEFKIQTSLTVARDRVVGILLGLFMMWLFFDHLWSAPAGVEMKSAFISNLRLLAQLAREPASSDIPAAIERSYALRETINTHFDKVRSLADGVLFEFGPSRRKNLELRDQIRRWQPRLRTLFVMRVASLKYRLQLPGFELPEALRLRLQEYDDRSSRMLEEMADRIEGNAPPAKGGPEDSDRLLAQTLQEAEAETPQLPAARAQSFITLLRGIDGLTVSLAEEIATEFERRGDHSPNSSPS